MKKTKNTEIQNIQNLKFMNLPNLSFDTEFLLKVSEEGLTENLERFTSAVFGENAHKLTDPEKVFCLVKAIEGLEIALPLELECSKCNLKNPIAVDITKCMKYSSIAPQSFEVHEGEYIFYFTRPQRIEMPKGERYADFIRYMLQWLDGHKGPVNNIAKLPIGVLNKLLNHFADAMFTVSFDAKWTCGNLECKEEQESNFGISVDDIRSILDVL